MQREESKANLYLKVPALRKIGEICDVGADAHRWQDAPREWIHTEPAYKFDSEQHNFEAPKSTSSILHTICRIDFQFRLSNPTRKTIENVCRRAGMNRYPSESCSQDSLRHLMKFPPPPPR
jgi:hypothetical protein